MIVVGKQSVRFIFLYNSIHFFYLSLELLEHNLANSSRMLGRYDLAVCWILPVGV